jgi:hypothetical protein
VPSTHSRAGGNSYELSATCATASGNASQSATVGPIASGAAFYNTEYNVSGTIASWFVNSQTVTLSVDSDSASINLSR